MFTPFLFHLRAHGLKVSLTEWLSLLRALSLGHARSNLNAFYALSRSLLVKREGQLDNFDKAFATYFAGVEDTFSIDEEVLRWLSDPKLPRTLTDEERAALAALDLEELRRRFEERLAEQKERHDGGDRWVGTGGTSPFGHGGENPAGVRVGGTGGGRSAVQIATERRFENLRHDRVLDTRQIGVALRRLRTLVKSGQPEELDIEGTIDKTAREGGEIDLVFSPPRKNRLKLLLLLDVGGSMDPHAHLSEQLFSAAHAATHFKAFRALMFHNCPYGHLYTDINLGKRVLTDTVLKEIDETWSVVFVGDAWMSPFELTHQGGAIDYRDHNVITGIEWLRRFRRRCPRSVWLNPEPERVWHAPSITLVRSVFPMFQLSIQGLTEAVDVLRGARREGATP